MSFSIEGGHSVGPNARDRLQRLPEGESPITLSLRIPYNTVGKLIEAAEPTKSSLSEAFYDTLREPVLDLALKKPKKIRRAISNLSKVNAEDQPYRFAPPRTGIFSDTVIHPFKVPKDFDRMLGHIVVVVDLTFDSVSTILLNTALQATDEQNTEPVETTDIFLE
jgi:hypothetical protein